MSTETHTHLHLKTRELDTILAALRHWQTDSGPLQCYEDIAKEHGEPLDAAEIDQLCETININAHTNHPLDEVFAILDGQEWNAEHFEAIADVLREYGYTVRDPDEVEEEA